MKARILTTATLATVFSTSLPAVDSQLLNLVMPDAKMLAGVNVARAKLSPFGMYVLAQVLPDNPEMHKLAAQTGFDPRQDVNEVLVASNGAGPNAGLALASGIFNPGMVASAAQKDGGVSENYRGVTILESPKQTEGFAFLGSTVVMAGSVANVKAAIDRQISPAPLPAALIVQVNQLSNAEDAWAITTVPPSSFNPTGQVLPGVKGNTIQQIQQGSAGVKFGADVAIMAQGQTNTAADATNLVGALQLMTSLLQMQAANNPQAAALAKSVVVTATGTTVNVSLTVPEAQLRQLVKPKTAAASKRVVKM